jgi:CubicO group peptidase (beta-lactamase class C family)
MRFTVVRGIALAVVALAGGEAMAQDAAGDWWGLLGPEDGRFPRLRLAAHIKSDSAGALTGTFDSLDQNAIGLPLTDISVKDGMLGFTLPAVTGRFVGRWDPAAKVWAGVWTQNGGTQPLRLAAGAPPPAVAVAPPPLPADWAIPADGEIARLIDERIAGRKGEGIVIGVLDPAGTRIVARGPAGGTPVDARTLFEIGSMSKVFTALILADMVGHGEVALDDPAEKYLPAGAHMPQRGGKQITLRDLATHMSGLPRLPDNMPFGNPDDPYADYDEKLLLDFLGHHTLTREIGSRFEYSNLGFGLLGYLLARVAHTDYATLVAKRITGPLGMRDTVILLSGEQKARFAQGHDAFMRPAAPWTLPTLAGAGAIRSTAADMLKFLGAALDPKSPIAPAMKVALADRRSLGRPGTDIGLAWMVSQPAPGRETLFHDGGTGGYRTAMALEPAKRRAVVVLTNAAVEPSADDLAMHLLIGSRVLPAGTVPPAPPPAKAHKEISLPPAEFDRVVGRYELSPVMTVEVSRTAAGVQAQLTGQPAFPIYPEGPLAFFWKIVDAQLTFTVDAAGKVTGAVLHQLGQDMPGKRVP